MEDIKKATVRAIIETIIESGQTPTLELVQECAESVPEIPTISYEEFQQVMNAGPNGVTHIEAQEQLLKLENSLHENRQNVSRLQREERLAKDKLSRCMIEWTQDGSGPTTHEELAREFQRASLEERRRKAEAGLPATMAQARRGRSYLDRMLAGQTGGNAEDFARKQLNTGHRRGSVPASARGRTISPEAAAHIRRAAGMKDAAPFTATPKDSQR